MARFAEFLDRALSKAGSASALEALMPEPKSEDELRALPDDRCLSQLCLRVFRAGLKHSLVDAKWPAFEDAFQGFDPRRIVAMSDEDLERLMGDRRLIRHWNKLRSVRDNAAAVLALNQEGQGFGGYLADWPVTDITGLWADLGKRFKHMGGNSGPSFLRMVGKDTFLLTGDVSRALIDGGIVEKPPTAKRDLRKVQAAFNAWHEESGRPLCHISRILALSVD